MRIALDAMGGDNAPGPIIEGALDAARDLGIHVLLVGRQDAISDQISARGRGLPVELVHASEVIEMGDTPATAVRRKKDASMLVAMRLVRDGRADAFVSAGNSGAVMAAALMVLGRCNGVDRPAIGAAVPTQKGFSLIVDAGANADSRPANLLQFARMGSIYMSAVFNLSSPTVGLLSNGEEDSKGNTLAQETFPLLKNSGLNFVGNVEGREINQGKVDVTVTDGFTGNVVLKTMEGTAELVLKVTREEVTRSLRDKLGAALLLPAFKRVQSRLDPHEVGGAPLLGVNGVVLVAHGRSDARAIRNALRVAGEAAGHGIIQAIDSASGSGSVSSVATP